MIKTRKKINGSQSQLSIPQKRRYWLFKSEPDEYSIEDLAKEKKGHWNGVRNFQARNFLRDQIQVGDGVLFYHSSISPPGVAGVARVVRAGYPDFTAWDAQGDYFDPRSTSENPLWYMVDIEFVEKFSQSVSLDSLKKNPKLAGLMVTRRGMRLSVQPVSDSHFLEILKMGKLIKTKSF